jgi:2,3-bisphosphoglycerate-independent phosphoglycerate mutase
VADNKRPRPAVLCVLDGWGFREDAADNAITRAKAPNFRKAWEQSPHALLDASETFVGLPKGQIGNSEVGHMNLGAGRVIFQDLPMIDRAIEKGELAKNPALQDLIGKLKQSKGACHIMGLASKGGVHAHQDHMVALAREVTKAGVPVVMHAFLDGRDVPPKSAADQIVKFASDLAGINSQRNRQDPLPLAGRVRVGGAQQEQSSKIEDSPRGTPPLLTSPARGEEHHRPGRENITQLSTLCGRYYAMDRDKRWERVEKAYDLLVSGTGAKADDPVAAIKASYAGKVTDEFVLPVALGDYAGMKDGDGILFANFRADRAREILQALLEPDFKGFNRKKTVKFAAAAGMVEYSDQLNKRMSALFPPKQIENGMGDIIAHAGLKQLRIAETEKYPHVTFFFNGGREEPYAGEERIMVPSPKVATYDMQPEMSAYGVTDRLVEAVNSGKFDFIVVNFANSDMVGHTGIMSAAVKAVEAVDACLGKLFAAVEKQGGFVLLTADHGNCERMKDPATGGPHTAHTLEKVPVILINGPKDVKSLHNGKLADVAPTLLQLMNLPKPKEMDGKSLLQV